MNKKTILIICSVVLAVSALLTIRYIFSDNDEIVTETEESAVPVKVINLENSSEGTYLDYSALIQPKSMEQVNFATIGTVLELYVKEGDDVVAGQEVAKLDDSTAQDILDSAYNSMVSAQNTLNDAKSTYESARNEYNSYINSTESAEEIARLKSVYEDSQKEEDALQDELDNLELLLVDENEAVDTAQNNFDIATADYNAKSEELANDPENVEKQEAVDNAEVILEEKREELTQARVELAEEEVTVGKTQTVLEHEAASLQTQLRYSQYQAAETTDIAREELLETNMNTANLAYNTASNYHQTTVDAYNLAEQSAEDKVYYAKTNGTVISIISEEGNMATPLAPVLVIGSHEMVAEFGVSASDYDKISAGNRAEIEIGDTTYTGEVISVAIVPDETTRTYLTTVSIENHPNTLALGELVKVKISSGEQSGIWLPLNIIMNDGTDYVYIIEDNRAVRVNIELTEINEDKVLVEGLKNGDMVVSQGMKTIEVGTLVSVVE